VRGAPVQDHASPVLVTVQDHAWCTDSLRAIARMGKPMCYFVFVLCLFFPFSFLFFLCFFFLFPFWFLLVK
jgi:hypothetical protein